MSKNTVETNVVKPSLSIFENEINNRLITVESETKLDSKIKDIEDFMNNNHGRGKSELEKDKLYGDAKALWEIYAEELRNVIYTYYLNRKQYQFLIDLLRDKMEYDVNTVFLAIELTNMLGEWNTIGTENEDKSVKGYPADATEITYIYHLISKHKVKGLTHSSYRFAEVLRRIGDISKVISYYDTQAKNLSKEIQQWVASFEDNISVEGKDWGKETSESTPAKEMMNEVKKKSKKAETTE